MVAMIQTYMYCWVDKCWYLYSVAMCTVHVLDLYRD